MALIVLGGLAGYLVGSISFARLIGRLVVPGDDLRLAKLEFDEGAAVEVKGVSATSISVRAGRRWGLVVVVLDIAKAAFVTAAFRLIAPDEPAYLAAAAFVVVGHIWPVWFRFEGGFGISPMLGGLLAVDPVALLATIPVGVALGLLLADRVITYDGWTLLLAPWFMLVRDDRGAALYAVVITVLYWWAIRVELRAHIARLRRGPNDWRSRFADIRRGYTGDPGVG